MSSNVIIIGGGVIGMTIARELHLLGVRGLTVLERGTIGCGASYAAAGMLSPNLECTSFDQFHRFCTESLALWPDFAAALADETGVDVELDRSGTLDLAFDESTLDLFDRRRERYRAAGIDVRGLDDQEVRRLEPHVSPEVRGGLLYPNDWQVENRKVMAALKVYAELNRIKMVEGVEVESMFAYKHGIECQAAGGGKFSGDILVFAAGAWASRYSLNGAPLPAAVRPIRGQIISYSVAPGTFRHVIHGRKGYLVPRADGRVLIGATVEDAGFDEQITSTGAAELKAAAAEMAPIFSTMRISDQWAGLRPQVPADALPVLGEVPGYENVYIAAGHYRNGILLAPITAKLIAERIVNGTESPYLERFGLRRFSPAKRSRAS